MKTLKKKLIPLFNQNEALVIGKVLAKCDVCSSARWFGEICAFCEKYLWSKNNATQVKLNFKTKIGEARSVECSHCKKLTIREKKPAFGRVRCSECKKRDMKFNALKAALKVEKNEATYEKILEKMIALKRRQ